MRNDWEVFCTNQSNTIRKFLLDVAKMPKRKNLSRNVKLRITEARNMLFNSQDPELMNWVNDLDARD